ncbi:sulfurtransferase [Granulicoccus sp. GXG6511]|uniref:sulfurtransferase n=1 Tax=Granulicoccus sp. GXG6511 TaxID=3381351 RepID=UPI003D7E227A
MTVLISVHELRAALAGSRPPVVLDVRWPGPAGKGTGLSAYRTAHVPHSIWIDLDAELAAPASGPGGRHPLPEPEVFEAAMRRAGVSADRAVVVLDGGNSLAAGRLWWLLRDAGHDRVRVLDGGFSAWERAGAEVATGDPDPVAFGDFVARPGQLPTVDAHEILAGLNKPGSGTLWDVRAAERYRGDTEPIDPIAGHIPGARNLPTANLQHADGSFLEMGALRESLADVHAGDVVYCGSGITAAQALLALAAAGRADGVRLYPGSWSDWISSGDRPVEVGTQD